MKNKSILISGASGFIGSALNAFLTSQNYTVYSLVRKPTKSPLEILWRPETQEIPLDKIEDMDAFINLSGASITDKRWTKDRKKVLIDSRIHPTQTLAKAINLLKHPPKVFISMSGAGIYASTHNSISETGPLGTGFLSDLAAKWEEVALTATNTRVVLLRTGVVLSSRGGALPKLTQAVRFGFAGRIGSGHQMFPWISLTDLCTLILFCIEHPEVAGPVNTVAPELPTQEQVMKTIGQIIHRPSFIPCPQFLAQILFGQMADECLLQGQNLIPEKAIKNGFTFSYPKLTQCLEHELN